MPQSWKKSKTGGWCGCGIKVPVRRHLNEQRLENCMPQSRKKIQNWRLHGSDLGVKRFQTLLSLPTAQTVGVGLQTTAKHTRGVFTPNTPGSGWKWQVCGTLRSNILIPCRRQRCPPPPSPPPAAAATIDRRCCCCCCCCCRQRWCAWSGLSR